MLTFIAVVASGLLWLFGAGLHPVAALTWLAPLPLIVLSLRVRARTALLATVLAWVIGQVRLAGYYHEKIEMPVPAVAGIVVLGAGLAAGTVLLARLLLLRGRTVTAVLAVPSVWVLGEYAVSLALPNGAWWSLGYSQAGVRPVIQVAALTGIWGVTYLLVAVPVALAAAISAGRPAVGLRRSVACLAVLVVVAGGWAAWSLNRRSGGERVTVGLIGLEQSEDGLPIDRPEGRALLANFAARSAELAARGATIVVLPEKVFAVDDAMLGPLADTFRPVTGTGVRVVVGAVLRRAGTATNVALVLGAGGVERTYAKQNLIAGLEDWITPGHDDVVLDGRFGVAVCKDLDFPGLVRRYRSAGATVMLVPALDFSEDGWLHGRMAVVRGVESGMTVVRAADAGRLTVSDPTGRVLGEAGAGNAELLVRVPVGGRGTVYGRTGNGIWILIWGLIGGVSFEEWRRSRA